MKLSLSDVRWLRVAVSSFLIVLLSFLVVTIITAGYAFILAFEAHGKPDQAAINHFAATISRWFMPVLEMFFTLVVTMISTKKVEKNIPSHGLLIGILVGLLAVLLKLGYGGHLNFYTIVFFLAIVGLGFVGGYLNHRKHVKKYKSPA